MTALEMFEKLGYQYYRKTEYGSYIYQNYPFDRELGLRITFHYNGDYEIESLNRHFDCVVSVPLHKAITRQMKELGWIK